MLTWAGHTTKSAVVFPLPEEFSPRQGMVLLIIPLSIPFSPLTFSSFEINVREIHIQSNNLETSMYPLYLPPYLVLIHAQTFVNYI